MSPSGSYIYVGQVGLFCFIRRTLTSSDDIFREKRSVIGSLVSLVIVFMPFWTWKADKSFPSMAFGAFEFDLAKRDPIAP